MELVCFIREHCKKISQECVSHYRRPCLPRVLNGRDIRKDASKIQKESTDLNSDFLKRMKIIVQLPEGLGKSIPHLSVTLLFEGRNKKRKDKRKVSSYYS